MNIISNYNYYTYNYNKQTETKNSEAESTSSVTTNTTTNTAIAATFSDSQETAKYFKALAYDEPNSYCSYIDISAQPLNKTLTNYRDSYPNIIGFTAKTQSALNSLTTQYKTKLYGLVSDFSNCQTQEEFDSKMNKVKTEMAKLMNEFNSKLNDISAITNALPALSDVRDKLVGTDINMHNELENILTGVTNSSKTNSISSNSIVDNSEISLKLQTMKNKNNEYKEKLEKAKKAQNKKEIDENQCLITATQKLIDVYQAILKQ